MRVSTSYLYDLYDLYGLYFHDDPHDLLCDNVYREAVAAQGKSAERGGRGWTRGGGMGCRREAGGYTQFCFI